MKTLNERQQGEAEFVNAFEKHNKGMARDFGTAWKEFEETLIHPDPDTNDSIRNPHEVSRYLNDSTIIFPKVPFDFYRSVPNLLTGLGILGTFIGLAAGVGAASSGLSSNDPGVITASLQQLLGGASLAFITSIVGIMSSMGFVFFERRESRRLHLAVDRWVKSIESCVRRVTSERVATKQLKQLQSAAGSLERVQYRTDFHSPRRARGEDHRPSRATVGSPRRSIGWAAPGPFKRRREDDRACIESFHRGHEGTDWIPVR